LPLALGQLTPVDGEITLLCCNKELANPAVTEFYQSWRSLLDRELLDECITLACAALHGLEGIGLVKRSDRQAEYQPNCSRRVSPDSTAGAGSFCWIDRLLE